MSLGISTLAVNTKTLSIRLHDSASIVCILVLLRRVIKNKAADDDTGGFDLGGPITEWGRLDVDLD